MVHISSVDLNLLSVAAALYRHRNASRAAKDLGVSQSAVSHALSRLRRQFGDPLFVRSSKGVVPTEFARGIEAEILEIVRRSESLFARRTAFDPREARGRITISTTDYFEAAVMPLLYPRISEAAPGVRLSLRPTGGELPKRALEEGEIDLAVAGFYSDLPEGFFQGKLFTDGFALAARKGHPKVRGPVSREEYFGLRHALITLQGDFRDRAASGSGKSRRARELVYGSYSFTGLAWLVESSDLVLTAPSLLVRRFEERFAIRSHACPVDLGTIDIRMLWHERTHTDPLRAWFRGQLREVCAGLGSRGR